MATMTFRMPSGQDIFRIFEKLEKGKTKLKKKNLKIQWRVDLLDKYAAVVQSAMGSVRARGGYASISFNLQGQHSATKVKWQRLSRYTLNQKAGYEVATEDLEDIRAEFRIWVDTGTTKDSVKVSGNFAGIVGGAAYERAKRTEEGGISQKGKPVPPRPLFNVANDLFLQAIDKAFENPNSLLATTLRQELVSTAFADWGKR